MEIRDIINRPVRELKISADFDERCKIMGIYTLKDILLLTPAELISKVGFTYHWLGDLVSYLSKHKLLHYLQPGPGQEKPDVSTL
jgi:hypothetical protein